MNMGSPWKALLVLAVPMIVISWMIMFVMNFISISQAMLPAFRHFEDPEVLAQRTTHWQKIAPKDSLDHLVWFLQVRDGREGPNRGVVVDHVTEQTFLMLRIH
jgi:hypothetical protein